MNDYDFSTLLTMQQSIKKAMLDIGRRLNESAIPYIIEPYAGGFVVKFPWCNGDIACNSFTYYHEDGLVETYQFPWDNDDVTVLAPEEAVDRIVDFYSEKGGSKNVGE